MVVGVVLVGVFKSVREHSIGASHTHTHTAEFHPTAALLALQEKVTREPEHMVHCHMETHMIGHQAYDAYKDTAYTFADPMCGGGYLHGVIEQAFKRNGVSYLDTIAHDLCNGEITESCLHGVGHGLHEVLRDIPEAVSFCELIATSHTDCFDGVFMDAFDSEGMSEVVTMEIETAQAICGSTVESAQDSCYFYLPRLLAAEPYTKTIELCSSSEIGSGWAACAQGSGVFFMKSTSGFSAELAEQYCSSYQDDNLAALCVNGVLAYATYGSAANTRWH